MDEEVENVEYLEDVEGNNVDCATFEDPFYPNAVQCLIALYRNNYEHHMDNPQQINTIYYSIWVEIARDMQESYFEFNADQVREKFSKLRQQYFEVQSKSDIEKFDDFQPIHEIYNDKIISSYLKNEHPNTHKMPKLNISRSYRDDVLFGPPPLEKVDQPVDHHIRTKVIEQKEGEFMNLIQHQLETIDKNRMKVEVTAEVPPDKRELQMVNETKAPGSATKRRKFNLQPPSHPPANNLTRLAAAHTNDQNGLQCDMTLADYNEVQQRRHEEKMDMFRESMLLQERFIEVQTKLLDQIIKRVP